MAWLHNCEEAITNCAQFSLSYSWYAGLFSPSELVYANNSRLYVSGQTSLVAGQTESPQWNVMYTYLPSWCSGICCLLTDQTSCITGTGALFYQHVLLLILLLMYHHNGGMYELIDHLNCLNRESGLKSWAARALHPLVEDALGQSL